MTSGVNTTFRSIELIALDMAGTTIDEGGLVYRALEAAVLGTGATVETQHLQSLMGTEKRSAIAELSKLGGVTPTDEVVDRAFAGFRDDLATRYREQPPKLLAGVRELVGELRSQGIKIALTTGFDAEIAGSVLEACDWQPGRDLDAVVSSDQVTTGRPAPYLIFHAMELTDVIDVRRVIAAGDTVADLQAARNAGVYAIGVCTGKLDRETLAAHDHDLIIDSAAELGSLVS